MQNFGKIKNVFNNLVIEGIGKKNDEAKGLFKQYLKLIRENEILKTQFKIYKNIESKSDPDVFSASIFATESIKLMEKYDKLEILRANQRLVNLLGETKLEDNYDEAKLHESITNLIFTNRNPNNIEDVTISLKNVTNHIVNNESKVIKEEIETVDMPISFLTKFLVDRYNEEYSTLNEDDKQVVKVLINSNLSEKQELYNKFVFECKELAEGLIKEADTELKEKLLRVKNKLESDSVINEDNFITKVSEIVELKNNLKTN